MKWGKVKFQKNLAYSCGFVCVWGWGVGVGVDVCVCFHLLSDFDFFFLLCWFLFPFPISFQADASERLRQAGVSHVFPHPLLLTQTRSCPLVAPPPPPKIPAWKLIRPKKKKVSPSDEPAGKLLNLGVNRAAKRNYVGTLARYDYTTCKWQ